MLVPNIEERKRECFIVSKGLMIVIVIIKSKINIRNNTERRFVILSPI